MSDLSNELLASVDVVVLRMDAKLDKLQVMLVKRDNEPFKDHWAIPGTFIRNDERAYQAVQRTLREKTSIKNAYIEQLYTLTQVDRDPRGRVISVGYLALIPYNNEEGDWFSVDMSNGHLKLSKDDEIIEYALNFHTFINGALHIDSRMPQVVSEQKLAFDHEQLVYEAIQRVKNKAEYSDVVFNLMPSTFTLPDLQKAYETVLQHPIYKANFRDTISLKVECTNTQDYGISSSRKATIYKRKY